MADPANSVAVATGSLDVAGTGTAFIAAESDVLIVNGTAAVIASRVSSTALRLKQPWPAASVQGSVAWNLINVGPYWQSTVATNLLLNQLLAKFDAGPVKWDASGSFDERDQYNGQPKNFVYLSVDPLPFRLYVKIANTNSAMDWSAGQILGDRGPVAFEEALNAEVVRATGSEAAIREDLNTETTRAQMAEADGLTKSLYVRDHLAPGIDGAGVDIIDRISGLIHTRFGKRGIETFAAFIGHSLRLRGLLEIARTAGGSGTVDFFSRATGAVLARLSPRGFEVDGLLSGAVIALRGAGFSIRPLRTRSARSGDLVAVDRLGFLGPRLSRRGILYDLSGTHVGEYTAREVAERNARALALAVQSRQAVLGSSAALAWAYNFFLLYGQSLAAAQEAWPALTTDATADVLMWGQCERPSGPYDPAFVPVGNSALNPLVATCQKQDGTMLTASQAAALPAGDASFGESILPGALRFARSLYLKSRCQLVDTDHRWVAVNAAVSGRTIEQLSKGANPNLYGRITDAVSGVKAALPSGATFGMGCALYLQGEFNYIADYGGATMKEAYKGLLRTLFANVASDSAAITSQADPAMVLTYQTGATFTVDATGLSIGMAQWEVSQEQDNWHLVAPSYPVTDKGGHLDPNGSRWLGCQFGKVIHETVVMRRRWKPTSPLRATVRGRTLLADFHVPCPPLQFRDAAVGNTLKSYAAKGFTVTDATGKIPISSVRLISETGVALSLGRDPIGPVTLWYGRLDDAEGGGNLCDSDPTRAPFAYAYTAGNGQYPSANIAALVGKPYPLWNWCIAFAISVARD